MILKIAVCDDNDKDIEIINRELLLLEVKCRMRVPFVTQESLFVNENLIL